MAHIEAAPLHRIYAAQGGFDDLLSGRREAVVDGADLELLEKTDGDFAVASGILFLTSAKGGNPVRKVLFALCLILVMITLISTPALAERRTGCYQNYGYGGEPESKPKPGLTAADAAGVLKVAAMLTGVDVMTGQDTTICVGGTGLAKRYMR